MKSNIVYWNQISNRIIAIFRNVLWVQFHKRVNHHSRRDIVALILALCFVVNPTIAFSASPENNNSFSGSSMSSEQHSHKAVSISENANFDASEIKEHVIKFYLATALVSDVDFVKTVLPKYIADMNVILAKNTNRRLVFNPETDIIITDTQPHTNYASLPLPVEGFEIWAHAETSSYPYSYGGYGGLDVSGAGVLGGLQWLKIYDPDEVTGSELKDYWLQVNNMLHELAHVFRAGIGEYYKLATIQDTTGVSPLLNINLLNTNDTFWSDKPDFRPDPLLRNATQDGILNREDLLDYVKYSSLTATIMNGSYRNGTPTVDLQNITVSVVSESGEPISDANVKIWNVVGNSPFQTQLLTDAVSDSNGQISFAWGGSDNPHNNYEFLRLIKVYKDGYVAYAKYVSIFDADIEKLINGVDLYNISIPLSVAATLSVTSIVCASPNPTIASSVDFVVMFSESVSGVDESDFSVTKTGLEDAIVSGVSGSDDTYTVSVFSGSNGEISLSVVDNDTIQGLSENFLGGVGENDLSFTGGETCSISTVNKIFLPLIQY